MSPPPSSSDRHERAPRLAGAVMVASGFAGLGYQIVWTQQAALWLGHEAAAVLAVVTAFFGGLAIGAGALASTIERSRHPARWYAGCEALIALWSLVIAGSTPAVSSWLLGLTGAEPSPWAQWSSAFFATFLLLLPATAAMGATLPAMARVIANAVPGRRGIAGLYACNTLGATVGVLATAFWLVPRFGLSHTALVCALLNLVCAAVTLGFAPRTGGIGGIGRIGGIGGTGGIGGIGRIGGAGRTGGSGRIGRTEVSADERVRPPRSAVANRVSSARGLLVTLAATGLLGIGYEVLVVRVLSQVSEDTVYTFALLLAVYLVGTALGAAVWQSWETRRPTATGAAADRPMDALLGALASTCLLGGAALHFAESARDAVVRLLGPGMANALAGEGALALIAFGLPTFVMGMLFSALCSHARSAGVPFGRSLAVNTLGAAIAPLLFGAWLAPLLGPQRALVLVAAGYLALVVVPWRSGSRRRTVLLLAGFVFVAAWWLPPLAFVDVPEGGRIVSYQEGALAAVSIVEDAAGVSRLRIDNRQQEGTSASRFADARQALLPLLLHPAPRRALFLGLGTGVTAAAAGEDPSLQVDAVELLPEVINASAHFIGRPDGSVAAPRLRLVNADARHFVRATDTRYDVIVADNFHPARSGSGALYTVEHFRAVRDRLTPDGVFCQWLPLHQLDLMTLRSIVRSFIAVNPDAWAMLATNSLETPVLGLIARRGAGRLDLAQLRSRLADPVLRDERDQLAIGNDFALLGSFVAGPQSLRRFAGAAPLNTDDRPVVSYLAPRITYAPDSLPRDRLLELLHELAPGDPSSNLFDAGSDTDWPPRLAAYWSARDRFLVAGRSVQPSSDAATMLAQVREPLLSVLRISADFQPAYDPLQRMAEALAADQPAAARSLLAELDALRPRRAKAPEDLERRPVSVSP